MENFVAPLVVGFIQTIILGGIAWAIKAWISRVTDKLDILTKEVHQIHVQHAKDSGSSEKDLELLRHDLDSFKSAAFERFARIEASDAKQWSLIDKAFGRSSDAANDG